MILEEILIGTQMGDHDQLHYWVLLTKSRPMQWHSKWGMSPRRLWAKKINDLFTGGLSWVQWYIVRKSLSGSWSESQKKSLLLEIDFDKARDWDDSTLIIDMLSCLGFGSKCVCMINTLFSSTSTFVAWIISSLHIFLFTIWLGKDSP